jgi:hypothetical protein
MVKVWWTRSGITVCVVRENDAVVTPLLASHIQPALPLAQLKLDPVVKAVGELKLILPPVFRKATPAPVPKARKSPVSATALVVLAPVNVIVPPGKSRLSKPLSDISPVINAALAGLGTADNTNNVATATAAPNARLLSITASSESE